MAGRWGRQGSPGLTRRAFLGRATGALAASGTAALVGGCGGSTQSTAGKGSGGSGGLEPVTFLSVIPLNLSFIDLILGKLNGHFKKAGMDVSVKATRGSASALQAVLQGSALVTAAGSIETVQHIATKDAPLMGIGMRTHKSPLGFVSWKKHPLTEPEDWIGKRMGVPSEGGTSELTFDLFLASAGVSPDKVNVQVTGFSPGTFQLVKKGRIDGYVIGTSVKVIFKQKIHDAVVIDPSKYIQEGFGYITSRRSLQEKHDLLEGYMKATHAGMEDVLDDRDKDYKNVIKLARTKYDFPELKEDSIARGVLDETVTGWLYAGKDNLLRTVPKKWQKVYDELVGVHEVPGDKDPSKWFTNELVR
ncbi:MAG: ABC transporter substrate-binding protein [Streptosporangiaceae bacterium]